MVEPNKSENFQKYAARVRNDHYFHWAVTLAIVGYAWQLHGFGIAVVVLVGLLVIISGTNGFLMFTFGSLRAVRFNRWIWLGIAFASLAISGASIETAI